MVQKNQLQQAINLARITGDNVIVVDGGNVNKTYVIMNLDEYEKIVLGKNKIKSLTEDELLNKINRDIAVWKNDNELDKEKSWESVGDILNNKNRFNQEEDLEIINRNIDNNLELDNIFNDDDEDVDDYLDDVIKQKNNFNQVEDDNEVDEEMYYYNEVKPFVKTNSRNNFQNNYHNNKHYFNKKRRNKRNKPKWTIPSNVKEKAV